jgi:3-dehydroquinate synthase
LNFGHTIGHAIESCYRIPHGDAVAIGMCLEAQFAVERNELTDSANQQMVRLIEQYKFPVNLNLDPERIMQSIVQDKKRQGEHIDFILLKRIGHAEIQSVSLFDLSMFLKNSCT